MKSKIVKIVRRVLPKGAVSLLEDVYRGGRIRLTALFYGYPARNLKIIAVTGTDGKTSTCAYINQMLKAAGYKTAMFTTAVVELEGRAEPNHRHTTVPLTTELQKFFREAKQAETDYVILEVTSHALDQSKLVGTPIEVAVITNLSQEHLDYHGTMEKYAAAKAKLLTDFNPKFAILNRDDEWFDFFSKRGKAKLLSFGEDKASDIRITGSKFGPSGADFKLELAGNIKDVHTDLAGKFNVHNAAAAAGVGQALGLSPKQISEGISALKRVPGRMERVEAGQPFDVIVDYAVTPSALAGSLQSLRAMNKKGRIIVVFGATGDRDKSKRPMMGKEAVKNADLIFLTDDETYGEDPTAIRKAVYEGITAAGGAGKTKEIGDRREAIKTALEAAKAGDSVLLTGIGHQNYRNMGGQKQPWNEIATTQKLLKDLN